MRNDDNASKSVRNEDVILIATYSNSCWTISLLFPNYPYYLQKKNKQQIVASLNRSVNVAGGKHYQKITIAIFSFVLQNFTVLGYFPYIPFYSCLFSLLSSGWFAIAVQGAT